MSKLKIGLIARPETARGLGIQTQEMAKHLDISRTLVVEFAKITGPRSHAAFSSPLVAEYNEYNHTLDPAVMRYFLTGLDVVLTAETPYDWSMLDMAREMGVKTVIQGNPEFVRHNDPRFAHMPHPTRWWWPTTWRLPFLPAGDVVPVPMPEVPVLRGEIGGRLKVLHVAGHRAFEDRNGTGTFFAALRHTKEPMDITVVGVDGELPIPLPQSNLGVRLEPFGLEDRWEMYRGQHLVVLPRKYGGLCLPALEAMAAGIAVAMTDTPPNLDWPVFPLKVRRRDELELACGRVEAATVDELELAADLDAFALQRFYLEERGNLLRSRTWTWTQAAPVYMQKLEEICAG